VAKITYDGFVEKNGIPHVCFKNEAGDRAEVPIDPTTAQHIKLHLDNLAPGELNPVERGNESPS